MTANEIFLFHKTGYPLSWIKHALQQCDNDKDKAYEYLKEHHGNNFVSKGYGKSKVYSM